MASVLEIFPGAQRALFRKYHIGGCSSCAFQPTETLQELCQRKDGLNVDEVMAHLTSCHEQDEQLMLDPSDVDAMRKANQKLKLLDIRTSEEWDAVKIEGAVHMSQETMQEILGQWSPEDLLVIYDHQGKKSLDAAAYFQGQGFKNVKCLRGGIDAWSVKVDSSLPRYELQ
jgi:rhodanese-related sulfurtransferase